MKSPFAWCALALMGWLSAAGAVAGAPAKTSSPITLVVMDPLAREMACACVKGHGQRDYRKLAARLESALKQKLRIEFSDDLPDTLSLAKAGPEIVVIGDRSLVETGAGRAGLKCHAVCELTDLDGNTTLAGTFVVRSADPAKELKDLKERKLIFGLAESDQRRAAAFAALRAAGAEPDPKPATRAAYTDAALDLLDSKASPPPVAVIPGYGLQLLEGCHSVQPGELRAIGSTEPVPFITVFVSDTIAPEKESRLVKALVDLKRDLKQALESRDGFRPVGDRKQAGWPDWRGPNRDGRVARLPARLPAHPAFAWKKAAIPGGLAGLSVADNRLIVAERDFRDEADVYRCLDANSGELLWRAEFSARGKLDYGQAPRATPVIHGDRAYLLGAFGDLRCVRMHDGKVQWERNLPKLFKAGLPTWGMCATPLVVDDLLVVNPGATNASVTALDCQTGRTRWTAGGAPAAYSAFICGQFGGRRQIVGFDRRSLGGWDPHTGERLWQLAPANPGDFNVPTPLGVDGAVILSTENNGTRLHKFDPAGRIVAKPAATFAGLAPDSATPVATCGRIFGVHPGLHCLDVRNGLTPVWQKEDEIIGDHATLIADSERVLVITVGGELLLLDAKADRCVITSRVRIFKDDVEIFSHPAMVGSRLYIRGGSTVACVDLDRDEGDRDGRD